MFDALISAIDDLVAFVNETAGTRPPTDFQKFLSLDQEVAALCQAAGVVLPPITYVGSYGDRIAGCCKIPVSRNTAGVRFWHDPGWLIAMQGLRRCAELKAQDRKRGLQQNDTARCEQASPEGAPRLSRPRLPAPKPIRAARRTQSGRSSAVWNQANTRGT
jgi:hypothetical protein